MFQPTTFPMQPNPFNINPQPQPQPQNAFNFNPQPQQMPNIDGKPISPFYVDQLKQLIDAYNQLQWDCNLQNLAMLLKHEQERSLQTMEKATSSAIEEKETQARKDQAEYVRQRCGKIKHRSQQLLIKMLNLREKMVNQMYMYKSRSPAREIEISQMSEKIRDLKYQISLKYSRLKGIKMSLEKEGITVKKIQMAGVNVPLLELKKGTQVLEKEALRLEKEFGLLQRFAHGQPIV